MNIAKGWAALGLKVEAHTSQNILDVAGHLVREPATEIHL